MKKLFIAIALLAVLGFAACSHAEQKQAPTSTDTTNTVTDTTCVADSAK